jgi:hypothetical protein
MLRWVPLALVVSLSFAATLLRPTLSGPRPSSGPGTATTIVVASMTVVGVLLLLSLLVRVFLQGYIQRRIGRADVFQDRIVLYKNERSYEVPWHKVKKLVVKSPHYVQIVRSGEIWGGPLYAVPTRDRETQLELIRLWEQSKRGAPLVVETPKLLGRATTGELLLVASGGAGWKRASYWLHLGIALIYVSAIFSQSLARRGKLPWMPLVSTGRWEIDFVATVISYRFIRRWLRNFTSSRIGRVEFFGDAIHFFRGDHATALLWRDVAGFDDGSGDFVRLVRQGGGKGSDAFTIPTPSEELRLRVLQLLDERGVPRVDTGRLVA